MAFKIEVVKGRNIFYVRCPRCHNNSGFSVAGIQQSPGVVRILLACTHNYGTIRRHQEQCGHILAFEGVIS